MFDILEQKYKNARYDTENKFYADVLYSQKEQAKAQGAQWDKELKLWYFENNIQRHNWDSKFYNVSTPVTIDKTHTIAVILGSRRGDKFKTIDNTETDLVGLSALLVDLTDFNVLKMAFYVLPGPQNTYNKSLTAFCKAGTIQEAVMDIVDTLIPFSNKIYTYGENLSYLFAEHSKINMFDIKRVLTNVKYNKKIVNKRLNAKGIRETNNDIDDMFEIMSNDSPNTDIYFGREFNLLKLIQLSDITPGVYNTYMYSNIPPVVEKHEMTPDEAKDLMFNIIELLNVDASSNMFARISDGFHNADYCSSGSFADYLRDKYGPVPYDYCTPDYSHVNSEKNSRSNEGLEIHHIYENAFAGLSDMRICKENGYEFMYQKAKNLVYCNKLEHLLMHILLARESESVDTYKNGVRRIISHINDNFEFENNPPAWDVYSSQLIWNKFDVYIALLAYISQSMFDIGANCMDIDSVLFSYIRCKPTHIHEAYDRYILLLCKNIEKNSFTKYNPFT